MLLLVVAVVVLLLWGVEMEFRLELLERVVLELPPSSIEEDEEGINSIDT
jgi:hypothetical protein